MKNWFNGKTGYMEKLVKWKNQLNRKMVKQKNSYMEKMVKEKKWLNGKIG